MRNSEMMYVQGPRNIRCILGLVIFLFRGFSNKSVVT